jgi:hypothetical protein
MTWRISEGEGMGNESSFLYQHSLTPTKGVADSTVTETGHFTAINRLAAAGFRVDVDGARLAVSPAALLTAEQRDWLATNKAALVAALVAEQGRWCIEYPRSAVAADSRTRLVADYLPAVDWRRVSADYPGTAVWPAPDSLDVAAWMYAGKVAL